MHLLTPEFFICIVVLFGLHWALPSRWRAAVLLTAGLGFAFTHALAFTALYLALSLGCYWAGRHFDHTEQRKTGLFILGLLVVLGNLTAWKFIAMPGSDGALLGQQISSASGEQPSFARIALPVGISYLSFRLVHYLVERYRGTVEDTGPADFLAYIFFFPVFLAGPLLRFDEYCKSRETRFPKLLVLNAAMLRILVGAGKKYLVADPVGALAMPILISPEAHTSGAVVAAIYGITFQLYMDFSGYSDIAIGLGRLFGITIPENFNYPFLKSNIAEFWRNWHMTLHRFFRDYVFLPLFGYRATTFKLYLGIGVTIFLFQVWHQASLNFVLLGLFHGFGVIGHQLFQRFKRRRARVRRLMHHKAMRPVATALTLSYFAAGNLLFMTDAHHTVAVMKRVIGL